MDHWNDIKRKAREQHNIVLVAAKGDPSAAALLGAAACITGISYYPVPAGDSLLDGGEAVLDREIGIIWYNNDIEPELATFYIAHEYAHLWLDGEYAICAASDIDLDVSEECVSLDVQRVEGYGPHERRECEANEFAYEFLLPAPVLREWYVNHNLNAIAVANRVGVSEGMVLRQLAWSLLIPVTSFEGKVENGSEELLSLDLSQQEAAYVERGPLLVQAGPGTGKTRTLVGRIAFLLDQGVAPSSILALTFSNKAADEMRARLGLIAPEAARRIWMGTFHAFGLELLRKFGTRLGLPTKLSVLDSIDALFQLERLLPSLQLEHYQSLYEPTLYLRDILSAISRAKDELVDSSKYLLLAEQMRANAKTEKEEKAGEKALEVARVYALYQSHLEQTQQLDFGDLIFRAVTLLQSHLDIRMSVQHTYAHVLVDEYQDVNHASKRLLQEIAGSGVGLWVVGDTRQAIYRFRGAAPRNMQQFTEDFPNAEIRALKRNYRSQPAIIGAFAALAPQMQAGGEGMFHAWEPHRLNTGGTVSLETAEDAAAEGVGIAREIARQRAMGIPYHDQAVLCRSHTALAHVAACLEQQGVPLLYLGNLFERSEVRDLLALLSLACEGDGHGLIRVARFVEYAIPLADVQALISLAQVQNIPFPRALTLAQDDKVISQQGKRGLALLIQHLDGLWYGTSAWWLLMHYLFVRSKYLHATLQDESVAAQQRCLALFQFIQFAHQQGKARLDDTKDAKRTFLQYVRRLGIFGEGKHLRNLPDGAINLNAVRLLTIHASKGMEFGVVYLPGLNKGYFPARRQWNPCPPPAELIVHTEQDEHEEEEECLFFVALSRARDTLYLSYVHHRGGQKSTPSSLLALIKNHLPPSADSGGTRCESCSAANDSSSLLVPVASQVYDAKHLDLYISCPRQYYYERVLGLSGRRTDTAYIQFHRCVYDVLHWLQEEQVYGRVPDEDAAQEHLAACWETRGPRGHPYESIYKQQAALLVSRTVRRCTQFQRQLTRPDWEVPLAYGRVKFSPDAIEVIEDHTGPSLIVQRFRTGHLSSSELQKNIYALYQVGARQAYPTTRHKVQVFYLSTDHAEEVNIGKQAITTRLARYDAAMKGILRREFPARPSDRECPHCPHYFVCPAAEEECIQS